MVQCCAKRSNPTKTVTIPRTETASQHDDKRSCVGQQGLQQSATQAQRPSQATSLQPADPRAQDPRLRPQAQATPLSGPPPPPPPPPDPRQSIPSPPPGAPKGQSTLGLSRGLTPPRGVQIKQEAKARLSSYWRPRLNDCARISV